MRDKNRGPKQTPRVKTVKCGVCGVYTPIEEAQLGDDKDYRCPEHRES